jgi:hypothetical protein
VISGRELYAWLPSGVQRSIVSTLVSEERLGVAVTASNWNAVTKLLALADDEIEPRGRAASKSAPTAGGC